jgi:hypothetical protein
MLVFLALPSAIIAWNEPDGMAAGFGMPSGRGQASSYARWRNRLLLVALGAFGGFALGMFLP